MQCRVDLSIFLHGHAPLVADVSEDGPSFIELQSNAEEWVNGWAAHVGEAKHKSKHMNDNNC